jgi:hypothetical protein
MLQATRVLACIPYQSELLHRSLGAPLASRRANRRSRRQRRGLLPQPGGFDGFRVVPEDVDVDDLALPRSDDAAELHLRVGSLARPTPGIPDDDAVGVAMKSVTGPNVSPVQVSRSCSHWRRTATRPTEGPGSGQPSGGA